MYQPSCRYHDEGSRGAPRASSTGFIQQVRELPLFIKRINWDHFIHNMNEDIVVMASLVSKPGPGDNHFFPSQLSEVCRMLMSDFQCNIGTVEALLRRKVKSTKPEDISKAPFSRLEQSCEDYVATLVHLMILLLHSLENENKEDHDKDDLLPILVPLSKPLKKSLQSLRNGLQMVQDIGESAQPTND